jgi:hypothetical protein
VQQRNRLQFLKISSSTIILYVGSSDYSPGTVSQSGCLLDDATSSNPSTDQVATGCELGKHPTSSATARG